MVSKKNSESAMAKRCVAFLEGDSWEVYQEVQTRAYGRIADIVAVRSNIVWVIECKTSFGLKVLDQASKWEAHRRSICIPERMFSPIDLKILNFLQLGAIAVDEYRVREAFKAPLLREFHQSAVKMREGLSPEHKHYAAAGTFGGGHFTPFRRTMALALQYIREYPGTTLKDIIENSRHHYASTASARSAMSGFLTNEFTEWGKQCRFERNGRSLRFYPVIAEKENEPKESI